MKAARNITQQATITAFWYLACTMDERNIGNRVVASTLAGTRVNKREHAVHHLNSLYWAFAVNERIQMNKKLARF